MYPRDCGKTNDCIRGNADVYSAPYLKLIYILIISFGCIIITTCMAIIVFGNWKNNEYFYPPTQQQQSQSQGPTRTGTSNNSNINEVTSTTSTTSHPQNTDWTSMRKVLMSQAFMYIGAFVLTWIFGVLRQISLSIYTDILFCMFFPLQGFFNCSIFLYHKVHNIKRLQPSITVTEALHVVLMQPGYIPDAHLSGISIVNDENNTTSSAARSPPSLPEGDGDIAIAVDAVAVASKSNLSLNGEISNMFDINNNFQRSQNNISDDGSRPQRQQQINNLNDIATGVNENDQNSKEIEDTDLSVVESGNEFTDNDLSFTSTLHP